MLRGAQRRFCVSAPGLHWGLASCCERLPWRLEAPSGLQRVRGLGRGETGLTSSGEEARVRGLGWWWGGEWRPGRQWREPGGVVGDS